MESIIVPNLKNQTQHDHDNDKSNQEANQKDGRVLKHTTTEDVVVRYNNHEEISPEFRKGGC